MHYIVYCRQDQKARKLKKRNVCFTQFCPLKPGFIRFKPGFTHWAGQNQFDPVKCQPDHWCCVSPLKTTVVTLSPSWRAGEYENITNVSTCVENVSVSKMNCQLSSWTKLLLGRVRMSLFKVLWSYLVAYVTVCRRFKTRWDAMRRNQCHSMTCEMRFLTWWNQKIHLESHCRISSSGQCQRCC